MKRPLLLLAGIAVSVLAGFATGETKINLKDTSWKFPATLKSRSIEAKVQQKNNGEKAPVKLEAGANDFVGALQTFYDFDYNFSPTDGIYTLYPMTVTRNGNEVIFGNLLNFDDEMMSYYGWRSVNVVGTYDEAAGTVTIPTPHENGYEMTIVGQDDYTDYALIAGHMEESMDFWAEDELVFTVIGDFERIVTTQNIGVISIYDGETGYLESSYSSMIAQPAMSSTPVVAMPQTVDLGESYPGGVMEGNIQLLNLGNEEVTFALSLPADEERLLIDPALGTVYPMESYYVNASYDASAPGEFSVPVRINYETSVGEAEVIVNVTGKVKDYPDYSAIVSEGTFSFNTNYDCPFELVTEGEGAPYARSTATNSYQASWMEASFEVPENCTGTVIAKGFAACADEEDPYTRNSASITLDNSEEPVFSTSDNSEVDLSLTVGPGSHTIRFSFNRGYVYWPSDEFFLQISDLALSTEMTAAEGVEVLTLTLDFGGMLISDSPVSKELSLEIRNMGSNSLSITGFESTDKAFSARIPDNEASLMESLIIPVTFTAGEPGEYTAEFTVATSAGAVTAEAVAIVRQMPDFSILLEGDTEVVSVTTDEDYPFVVSQEGDAYNINCSLATEEPTTSTIVFTVNVPDNKIVYASWDASFNGGEGDSGILRIDGPSAGLDIKWFENEMGNIGSDLLYPEGSKYIEMVPGTHTVEFAYTRAAGEPDESDRLSISRFAVTMEDFDPKAARLSTDYVRFADCLLPEKGSNKEKSFATVYIENLGSDELRVLRDDELDEVPDNYPFSYRDPGYVVHHGSSLMVDLVFFPESEGDFEGEVVIPTTFGEFKVSCMGRAYNAEGMLLVANFDIDDSSWTFIDKDGDGESWFNVTEKYHYRPDLQSFSGNNALMSYSGYGGRDAYPDNYAVSPAFSVPADGGMLSWWVAPVDAAAPADSYELSIFPADDYSVEKLGTYPVAFSETLEADFINYKENTFDLSDYAGKEIRLAFRHDTTTPQSGIRLDDVYAYTINKWNNITGSGVESVWNEEDVMEERFYDASGIRLDAPARGIVIRLVTLRDGSIRVSKLIIP